jgi:hypothetical protein
MKVESKEERYYVKAPVEIPGTVQVVCQIV